MSNQDLDIAKLLQLGQEKLDAKRKLEEEKKVRLLRGGSAGCIIDPIVNKQANFEIIGTCAREAHARFIGWDDIKSAATKIMFEGGMANEKCWEALLQESLDLDKYSLAIEQTITWEVSGIKASGRPDIVILNEQKEAIKGIELKNASAIYSAKTVLFDQPKLNHLIQAGNYAYRMGDLPYELWYTSYVNLTGKDWITSKLPKRGQPGSENIVYSLGVMKPSINKRTGKKETKFNKIHTYSQDQELSNDELRQKYGITDYQFNYIKPFRVGYSVRWNSGKLEYKRIGSTANWIITPITKEGIDQFYDCVGTMETTKKLAPRVTNVDSKGTPEYFVLDDYSSLQYISDQCNDDYMLWRELLRKYEGVK